MSYSARLRRLSRLAAWLVALCGGLGLMGAGCYCDPQDPAGFVYSCSDPRRPECPPNQRCGLCTGGQLMGLFVCGPLPSNATVTCNWTAPAGALTAAGFDPYPADVNLDGACDTVLVPRADDGAEAMSSGSETYVVYGNLATEPPLGPVEPVVVPPAVLAGARDCLN